MIIAKPTRIDIILIKDYVSHCNKILSGLESLKTLNEADIPNFEVLGILIYDETRQAHDIVSIRELIHTFKGEFLASSQVLKDDDYMEYKI